MRHLKVNSQKPSAGRRTIGTRNSKEIAAKNVQNDRNNIGKRIGAGTMPRTRRSATQANTPSTAGKTTVTSSNQNKIIKIQNGNDGPRNRGAMASLLKQRDEVMPCMTGSDRVANWKSSTQYAIGYYTNEVVVVSPRKQSVQRSSIQERISYGKVSSSTSFGGQSPRSNDFKVPSTIQRNENSMELIDLTDDASESNTSSITTTHEELYSYLGVVTKTQTNKVETETENKTVKRSSLRVKVKQIALRNQEIYNQLENNRKMEAARAAAAANTQSLVRYNGHRAIEQSSVQVRRHNGDPRQNEYASKQQQYTQSTYKSTTLVNNNATSTQPSKNNYRPVQTNRVNRQQYESSSSYQLVPYSFKPQTRITTNKCTVMERFVYKSNHVIDEPPRPIQVNADKYKPVSSSHSSTATTVNRITNGHQQIGSRSPVRKPEIRATRDKPPQITPGIKRKAMEQWMELSSTHPTSTNSLQSKVNSNTSSSFTSFHQHNTTTTTNISTNRKVQKLDVIYVKNQSSSNTFQTNLQPNNAGAGIVSPPRKIQMDPKNIQVRSNPVQNMSTANGLLSPRIPQQNSIVNRNVVQSAPIQSPSSKIIRPSNALALQTCSQKNIGNNRITKRRISPNLIK